MAKTSRPPNKTSPTPPRGLGQVLSELGVVPSFDLSREAQESIAKFAANGPFHVPSSVPTALSSGQPEGAGAAPDQGGGIAGGFGHLIRTTMPDELRRHNISDEELDVLCDPARDELWQLKWVSLGAFFSALPAALDGLYRYASSANHEMSVLTLVQAAIVLVAAAVWLVLRFIVPQKANTSLAKRDEIRARAKLIQEGGSNG